nr:DUF4347 domain-containing protein [uncultured Marinifilum sp.]
MRKLYSTLLLFIIGLMSPNFVVASNYDIEHLVFIDKSLPDYKILESSINLQASAIILIDPENYEGVLKITEEIQKYDELQSIHIVEHAKPAEIILGADSFWKDDLYMIQKELNSWKSHLTAGADLFLYGCSLADTEQGKETVDLMASLTGMDVIASTNLTGHSSLNGDWKLEYKTGTIVSPIAFSTEIKNYKHTLQSLNYSDLRTFEEINEGTSSYYFGDWTYPDGTGRTAYQSKNTGKPVYLLSKESGYLNQVYKGTITVSASDDDDIGFAFGFNGVNDTYIWSWDSKGLAMGVRSGGAHLLYHKTGSGYSFPDLGTVIAKGPNNDPWVRGVTYQIEILYTVNRIRIKVNGVEKFNVTAAEANVEKFPAGKFGFYNLSQAGVTFGNMQNAPASDDPVPPTAQDDSYGMAPNTTLTVDYLDGILKNDYDANLDEFTIVKMSDVSHGTLSLDTNDGSFTYIPTTNYQGADEFTYKLVQNDNGSESAVRTVAFGIITNNQAPTDIQLSNSSISEGAANNTSIGVLTTTDTNNPDDEHDYSLSDNGGGRFTVNGNNLIVLNSSLLTPGDYSITVRSTDLMGESYTESFTVSVIANAKPTSSNTQVSMSSGSTYSFQSSDFSFNDADGDTFGGIRIETAETAGDLEYNDSDVFNMSVINDISLLKFKAPANASGNPYSTFTFKVVDSRGGISTSTYTMSIEVINNPPVFTAPSAAFDISNAEYTGKSINAVSGFSTKGVTFSKGGMKMYLSGLFDGKVVEYDLSTPYDILTANFVQEKVLSGVVERFLDIQLNSDGSKLFMAKQSGTVQEYILSTPYDISTMSLNYTLNVVSDDYGIYFSNDGLILYVVGEDTKKISQYNLSTAFDLSTASNSGNSFTLGSEASNCMDVTFSTNGDKMLVMSSWNGIWEYNLSIPFNISTAVFAGSDKGFDPGTQEADAYGMAFNTNGDKFYIVGADKKVYQYEITASVDFAENGTGTVTDADANDGDGGADNSGITYSLTSGGDNDLFNINQTSGVITFKSAPDWENPGDSDTDNVYEITVIANDGSASNNISNQDVSITVTDVEENYLASVTTQAVSSISTTTATANGTISDLGFPNPTAHGVCWNTTGTPTILNGVVNNGAASATGAFTASMSSLSAGTLYYVRAYATNSTGTAYGEQVSFTTAKNSQTITFSALASKTYGDAPFSLTGTASSGLSVSYTSSDPSVATVSGNTVTIVGVGSTTITASQSGDASYDAATDVVQTLTVDKKAVSISNFNDMTKLYFDASFEIDAPTSNSAGAFTYSSSNTAVATVSGTTVTILSEGSTEITATQAPHSFYAGGSITATLTVNSVDVVTKQGENTRTNAAYVNKNGAVGGNTSVNKNGKQESTKSEVP